MIAWAPSFATPIAADSWLRQVSGLEFVVAVVEVDSVVVCVAVSEAAHLPASPTSP